MGAWGTGLYSGDFALDLRSTVSAVVRLPFADDELLALLRSSNPSADDPADSDHTTFWLVVADQFARRGVIAGEARDRALRIIDQRAHLANLRTLGVDEASVRKVAGKLSALRQSLVDARPKPRKTLKQPQSFVFEVGEVFVYPTSRGRPINSYYPSKDKIPGWTQDGWSAAVVLAAEHHLGYLAWYRLLNVRTARERPHTIESVWSEPSWRVRWPGTCSRTHRQRMEIATIGAVAVDDEALKRRLPEACRIDGRSVAVSDIGIVNNLSVAPLGETPRPVRTAYPDLIGPLSEVATPLR